MARRGHSLVDTYKDEAPPSFQNNFTAGLKTEFTGLNFPPNAATDTDNCIFTMQGDVVRRFGFDFELNHSFLKPTSTGAVSSYRWLNAGGDGETQIYVLQVGSSLNFYKSSNATTSSPLSNQLLVTSVDLNQFLVQGNTSNPFSVECQYSDGNGFLFIYNPIIEPLYCTFSGGTVTATQISIKVRDFLGYPESNIAVTDRLNTLTNEHLYNLKNQGWTRSPQWATTALFCKGPFGPYPFSNPTVPFTDIPPTFNAPPAALNEPIPGQVSVPLGDQTFQVDTGLNISVGDRVDMTIKYLVYIFVPDFGNEGQYYYPLLHAKGTVVSYSGSTLVINISVGENSGPFANYVLLDILYSSWTLSSSAELDLIDTWFSEISSYPSNADVWWLYKTAVQTATTSGGVTTTVQADTFDPGSTQGTVTSPTSPAPKGHFILNAFNQQQSTTSGVTGLTSIITSKRPRTGCWFQGRVFYTGVDDSQSAQGDQNFYTWTENIYFSQIITDASQFGYCYQTDDPTDENLFLLLPSDGGVITIQGSGAIYKLFPITNGMLVFAANGVWFITGSTGIGFTASDYTVSKISAVRSISGTSFVDVNGMPVFWNEEGIYAVEQAQQGMGLMVNPLTVGTIKSFYDSIPYTSKLFARGSYDPINYVVQWLYGTDVNNPYNFTKVLNLNVYTKAFYPWTISEGLINGVVAPFVHDVKYVQNPGGENAPEGIFKYVSSDGSNNYTFAESSDPTFVDWDYATETDGLDYSSYFITGFSLDGQGLRKFQPGYINVFSRNTIPNAYSIQGLWDYAISGASGRWTSRQVAYNTSPLFGMVHKRHKIRGQGHSLQFKFSSVDNNPFDIIGWSIWTTMAAGV